MAIIEEKFVTVDGVKLFCRIQGEGRPLLFLHGGPGSYHDYFVPFVSDLGQTRQLIFYDQRGCGRSEKLDQKKYAPEDFLRELEGLVRELNLEKFDLLGHSWGGMLAQLYAIHNQEKLRSMTLCCTTSNSESRKKLYARLWKKAPKESRRKLQEFLKSGSLQRCQPYPQDYLRILDEVKGRTQPVPKDLRVFLGIMRAGISWPVHHALMGGGIYEFKFDGYLEDFDVRESLPNIKIPTLIISGKNDLDFPERGKDLERLIEHSKLVLFQRSGHWPFLQENKNFLRVVNTFLSELEKD